MSVLQIQLTLSGRPLARCDVAVEGLPARLTTDERGCLQVELPPGKHQGEVQLEGQRLPFGLVSAAGLRQVRVDLREEERPIDDPAVLAAMPAERYVPLRLLGRGGAGAVFKCRDTSLDRLVAVKLMNGDFGATEEERWAFLAEARGLAQVEHPNLIQVYDVGMHQGRPYLVIQYVDGPNLEQVLRANGPLPPAHVSAVAVQMANALAVLHERGLVHRDIKPSNGLVDRNGRVRLADFGLVRTLADMADPKSRVYGTPAYMSPEQLQGKPLGPATDVFSLGASLFELLTGRQPFQGVDFVDRLSSEPPDLLTVMPDAPAELRTALREMMQPEAEARLAPTEVAELLRPLAAFEGVEVSEAYLPRLVTPDGGLPLTPSSTGPRTTRRTGPKTPAPGTSARGKALRGLQAQSLESLAQVPPSKTPLWMPVVLGAMSAVVATMLAIALSGDETPAPPPEQPQAAHTAAPTEATQEFTGTFDTALVPPPAQPRSAHPRAVPLSPGALLVEPRVLEALTVVRTAWVRDADRRAVAMAISVGNVSREVVDALAATPRREESREARREDRPEEGARRERREERREPEADPPPEADERVGTADVEPAPQIEPRQEPPPIVPEVVPEVVVPAVEQTPPPVAPVQPPQQQSGEDDEEEEEEEPEDVRPPVSF